MNSDLFGEPIRERAPRTDHREETKQLKEKHGIWTNYYTGLGWLAFSVTEVVEKLKGYHLTEEEKADPMLLYAGYCRLILEDYGLGVDGVRTEYEAVKKISDRIEKAKPTQQS